MARSIYLSQIKDTGNILAGLTTANLVEGSNLYFTNARVYSNIIALLPTLAGSGIQIQANGQISASGGAVTFASISQYLTTSNVSEGTNLYYTNARVLSALTGNVTVGNLTATSIIINTSVANSYTTTGNVNAGNVIATSITIGSSVANSYTTTGNVTAGNVIATVHQGNIWVGIYTANVIESNSNLYYTNARVNSNVIAFLPSLAGSGINIQANGQINANTQSVSLTGLSTTNLAEGSNLYYTNTRARTAYTAGKGIRILADGTIKSVAAGGEFNQSIDGGVGILVSNVNTGITFTGSTGNDRFILRSMQVTNISGNAAYISSNVLYANGNTGYLGNLILVPQGGFVEFIGRSQVFQPSDSIYFRGYDNNYTPTSNILSAYLTYESVNADISYVGTGLTMANANANVAIATADISDAIIESVKFVNLKPTDIPITLFIANVTTSAVKAYLAFNMTVPGTSSLEVLQSAKLLRNGDALYARYTNSSNADSISVFASYRKTDATTVGFTTPSVSATGTITVLFNTTISDGTQLYYTLE